MYPYPSPEGVGFLRATREGGWGCGYSPPTTARGVPHVDDFDCVTGHGGRKSVRSAAPCDSGIGCGALITAMSARVNLDRSPQHAVREKWCARRIPLNAAIRRALAPDIAVQGGRGASERLDIVIERVPLRLRRCGTLLVAQTIYAATPRLDFAGERGDSSVLGGSFPPAPGCFHRRVMTANIAKRRPVMARMMPLRVLAAHGRLSRHHVC